MRNGTRQAIPFRDAFVGDEGRGETEANRGGGHPPRHMDDGHVITRFGDPLDFGCCGYQRSQAWRRYGHAGRLCSRAPVLGPKSLDVCNA